MGGCLPDFVRRPVSLRWAVRSIKTSINCAAWETPETRAELLRLIPYGRIGEPADIAEAALWLASDLSDYVVGTTLVVDGGMMLYPGFRDEG